METSNSESDDSSSINNTGRAARIIRFLQSPVSSLIDYSGILRVRPDYSFSESNPLIPGRNPRDSESGSGSSVNDGEVSIRIIGEGIVDDNDNDNGNSNNGESDVNGVEETVVVGGDDGGENRNESGNSNSNSNSNSNGESETSPYQRFGIQQVARWIEQILPFSLLLLVVFIRQHLQGFCVTIYTTAFLFKSNDILRKQTALKGERKISVLVGYSIVFMIHISGVYWWHSKDDVFYPLLLIPPKVIPPFWHAIFIILINDTMVRQAAMILKLVLLMYYKNGRGHNFRRQGQMLTLVEYTLLLYRALLPTPVWYRFFLNKEYGSLFSSLTTGLYLTFKLTSIVEKVQSFFSALRALSRKEVHYGSHATSEQVNAAGDLCAICQEKMHTPILLRCKHIFCEDCVSEWFERERTCPLCRALVRPADLQSYGDGSTSLFLQLF